MTDDKAKARWTNWGDHPWFVILGAAACVATIVGVILAMQGTGRNDTSPSSDTRPSITLSQQITDASGKAINKQQAPFRIRVTGTAVDVSRVFVYLVVNDLNAEWIQPTAGLGPHLGRDFSGFCYLGVENDRASINKLYKVFAVATTRAYKEYERLDRSTIQAESSPIEVVRR